MAQYIQIKNPETNAVETKEVATILRHLNNLSADRSTEVINDMPVHTMLHAVRKAVSASGEDCLDCVYHVTFDNRLLRVRRGVLTNRIPDVLCRMLGITTATEGIYITEREGLEFKVRIRPTTTSMSPTRIKYLDGYKKVLPNVYDSAKLCFGNTHFRTENQTTATVFADVGRMLQSFFGSTFNNDLSGTGANRRETTQRNVVEFLREKGHARLAGTVEVLQSDDFGNVYTIWAIASISKESLSSFQSLIN